MGTRGNRATQTLSRRFVLAGVGAACIVCASVRVAGAQEGDATARAAAEAMFQEGRALMASGDFAAACPRFEQSLALYPALGVRFNLARCYEQIERPASAWLHYREVAERDGQARRAQAAREAAAALEPHLPRLVVQAPAAADTPGLIVSRDGAEMDARLLGTEIYVDPGEHELRATAPGYRPYEVRVRVGMDERIDVVVPPLQPEPTPTPAGPEPTAAPEPTGDTGEDEPPSVDEPPAGKPLPVTRGPAGGLRMRRRVAWATGGTGAAVLVLGLTMGLVATDSWEQAKKRGCDPETLTCQDPSGLLLVEDARREARVSTIATGAGAALLVTGAVFYWISRDTAGDVRSARVLPTAGPAGVGLAISGEF